MFWMSNYKKIIAIPSGVNDVFFPRIDLASSVLINNYESKRKEYFLSVCSIEPRKNIDRSVQAWLLSELPQLGYKLAFAGGA